MNSNLHSRAQELISRRLVEGIAPSEESWLEAHLADCELCRAALHSSQEVVRGLRRASVMAPKDLASRAQLRVRLRAPEIEPPSQGAYWLWILTAASWMLGVLTAPFVWRIYAWVGEHAGVPRLALQLAFVLWWAVPAFVALAIVLHQRTVASAQSDTR